MSFSFKRGLFAAGCLGALTVSAIYPAWGAKQQSQAYGGYVDMALQSLGLPTYAVAGGEVSMPVRVSNLGPETADFPQVIYSADSRLRLVSTLGCVDSPQINTRCQLGTTLAPGESRDVNFIATLDPSERGMVTLGTFALSEAIDVQPGNEQIIAAPAVYAYVDLQARVLNEQPLLDPRGRLIWELDLINAGISDALLPQITLQPMPFDRALIDCLAIGVRARCPSPSVGASIGAGELLRFTITLQPLSESNPQVGVSLNAYPQQGEVELDSSNNSIYVGLSDALFGDGFEF
jgi:hypothetical protein